MDIFASSNNSPSKPFSKKKKFNKKFHKKKKNKLLYNNDDKSSKKINNNNNNKNGNNNNNSNNNNINNANNNQKKKFGKKFNNKKKRKWDKNNKNDRKRKKKNNMNNYSDSDNNIQPKIEKDNSYPNPFVNYNKDPIPNRFINPSDTPLFQTLLNDQYIGLIVDNNCYEQHLSSSSSNNNNNNNNNNDNYDQIYHDRAKEALKMLGEKGFYVYDFTQPLGLNTPIARTFVTRTCIGKPGMTYKYLGLRMFAIPWSNLKTYNTEKIYDASTINALQTIRKLNSKLNMRGQNHLENNTAMRNSGSTNYNLTLINHMLPLSAEDLLDKNRKLKNETCFDDDPCAVSWHADSSLENYSTIAVYQALEKGNDYENLAWKLAVRVQVDAEGPNAGRARRNASAKSDHNNNNNSSKSNGKKSNKIVEDILAQNTPPLCIPLEKSGQSYFMFDTFNHHHQHAVLAGSCERWASTHRVCTTERHSVEEVLRRNISISQNEKNAIKEWTQSFNGLMEIEFEWLRQWYIQGTNHKELHLVYWQDKIKELIGLWGKFQAKERKKMKYLTNAVLVVESRKQQHAKDLPPPPRKQRKHAQTIENMGGINVYNACIELIQQLKKKRIGWSKRELDPIYKRVPQHYRPIKFYERFKDSIGEDENGMINADIMLNQLVDLKERYTKATT